MPFWNMRFPLSTSWKACEFSGFSFGKYLMTLAHLWNRWRAKSNRAPEMARPCTSTFCTRKKD